MPFGDSSILLKLGSDYSCGNLFSWILTNTFCFTWKVFKAVANACFEQSIVSSIFFLFSQIDTHCADTSFWKTLFSTLKPSLKQQNLNKQKQSRISQLGHFQCMVKAREFSHDYQFWQSFITEAEERELSSSTDSEFMEALIQDLGDTGSSFLLWVEVALNEKAHLELGLGRN